MLFALLAAPVLAQPPGAQPRPQPGGGAQPNGGQPGQGSGQPGAPQNGLALPPGYRPRTPPPQPQQPSQPIRQTSGAASTSNGTVMYFQKPADALTATGGGLPAAEDGVARAPDRDPVVPLPVPDVAPSRPLPPPVPLASAGGAGQPEVQPPLAKMQPGDVPGMSGTKQDFKIKEVDPKEIQLPDRTKIFGVVYDDAQLERAIMEVTIQDRIRIQEKQLKEEIERKADSRETEKRLQELRQDLRAIKDPQKPSDYRFPTLPVVSPPGVPYQPKTMAYAPRKLLLEPGYVVHRRLGFEQQNLERAGWDIGPLTTLLSAGQFYKSVLLWPQTLASGCAFGFWDTSAGKCLPGSPNPLYLYPPNLTVSGGLAEAGLITGFSFLFP